MSPKSSVTPLAHSIPETRFLLGGISRTTLFRYCRDGELVSRRLGGRRVILRSSIEAFLRRDHSTLTPEIREIRRKAGIKSGEARRKKSAANIPKQKKGRVASAAQEKLRGKCWQAHPTDTSAKNQFQS